MSRKALSLFVSIAVLTLAFTFTSFANVPSPPVNQKLGIPDSVFNNLVQEDCRFCHDNPEIVSPPPGDPNPNKWNVNRHHLRYGQSLEEGFCSVNTNDTCTTAADCNENICSTAGTPCASDNDCPSGQTCGETCIGDSAAPFPPAADGTYECTTCHPILQNGLIVIVAVRDCLFCHEQIPGQASIHHLTAQAQGRNCPACHGDLVDKFDDGHFIPAYGPSLITPAPSDGNGEPPNVEGNGAGACNYCHSTGTGGLCADDQPGIVNDPMFTGPFGPVEVCANSENHHSTGFGVFDNRQCLWCHNIDTPNEAPIRRCEQCHGLESLHNIAMDSDDPDDVFTPGMENPGWSHVGNNDDCWGCHGFSASASGAAPFSGPTIPYIDTSDVTQAFAGADTQIVLSGSNFQNTMEETTYTSSISLTDSNGYAVNIVPDFLSATSITFTIPASTVQGNYEMRAAKSYETDEGISYKNSNAVSISVIPDVKITSMRCSTKQRLLTINGSNLGEAFEVEGDYINVEVNGVVTATRSWNDSQITVPVIDCRQQPAVKVKALYGAEADKCSKGCVEKKRRRSRR